MPEIGAWLKAIPGFSLSLYVTLVSVPIMYEIRSSITNKSFLFSTGVQGVQVEELWSLDPEQFENLK